VDRWKKVLEAVLVCCFTATVGVLLMLWQNDCKPLGLDPTKNPVQVIIILFVILIIIYSGYFWVFFIS